VPGVLVERRLLDLQVVTAKPARGTITAWWVSWMRVVAVPPGLVTVTMLMAIDPRVVQAG
jgi:hypothetical protein